MEPAPPSQPPPRHRGRGIYLLPNLFTTGGLFAGFYAIIAATQGIYDNACIAIFVAAVLDGPLLSRDELGEDSVTWPPANKSVAPPKA